MHTKSMALIKITLLLTSMLIIIANATIAPTLPAIQATFADTPGAALLTRLVFTMPALFVVLGSLVAGTVIDKFGRKPLLIGSAILYALAGGSGFLLDNLFLILIGRALLGLALAGIMTTITTLIADYFVGEESTQFLDLQFAVNGASAFVWSQPIVDTLSYGTTFIVVGAFVLGLAIILFAARQVLQQPVLYHNIIEDSHNNA